MDLEQKRKLIDVRKTLKRKLFAMKINRDEEDALLRKNYKHLIEPLSTITANIKELKEKKNEKQAEASKWSPIKTEKSSSKNRQSFTSTPVDDSHRHSSYLSKQAENVFETLGDEDDKDNSEDDDDNVTNMNIVSELNETLNKENRRDELLGKFSWNVRNYINNMLNTKKGVFDYKRGVHFNTEAQAFYIGNKIFEVNGDNDNEIIIGNRPYEATVGLLELIFKQNPIGYQISDLYNYRDILLDTSALHRNYDSANQVNGSTSKKYRTIIKPLLRGENNDFLTNTPSRQILSRKVKKVGRGISDMIVENKPFQYVYWNDIDELIDRLCLLHASQQAGNTSHTNEIIAIQEELREAKVIQ